MFRLLSRQGVTTSSPVSVSPSPPILHYDDVHRPPQSSATLGISAQNFVLKTRVHIEKKKLL